MSHMRNKDCTENNLMQFQNKKDKQLVRRILSAWRAKPILKCGKKNMVLQSTPVEVAIHQNRVIKQSDSLLPEGFCHGNRPDNVRCSC